MSCPRGSPCSNYTNKRSYTLIAYSVETRHQCTVQTYTRYLTHTRHFKIVYTLFLLRYPLGCRSLRLCVCIPTISFGELQGIFIDVFASLASRKNMSRAESPSRVHHWDIQKVGRAKSTSHWFWERNCYSNGISKRTASSFTTLTQRHALRTNNSWFDHLSKICLSSNIFRT